MQEKPLETTPEDIRLEILDAAEARFRVYGLNKTTMAEIAHDTGMSAANLYRYFKNKQDIGAACAQRCIGAQVDLLREVVRTPGLMAAEKLERCVLEMLRYTWETTHDQPKINELVNNIILEHGHIVHDKTRESCSLLAEVGNRCSENGRNSLCRSEVIPRAYLYESLFICRVRTAGTRCGGFINLRPTRAGLNQAGLR